jgi:large subunit ribosomal protein L15
MPLQRRLPKAGFHNVFKQCYTVVSVDRLNVFADGEEITPVLLVERGVIRRPRYPVKLLAGKEGLTHPVVVHVDRASSSAVAQVEAAGGRVVIREASVDGVDGSGSNE